MVHTERHLLSHSQGQLACTASPSLATLRDQHSTVDVSGAHEKASQHNPQDEQHDTEQAMTVRLVGHEALRKLQTSSSDGAPPAALMSWQLLRPQHSCTDAGQGSNESNTCRATGTSFSVLASGLKPCSGLRVWLVPHCTQTRQAEKGGVTQTEQAVWEAVGEGSTHTDEEGSVSQGVTSDGKGSGSSSCEAVEITGQAVWLPTIVAAGRRDVRDWG